MDEVYCTSPALNLMMRATAGKKTTEPDAFWVLYALNSKHEVIALALYFETVALMFS